MGWLRIFGVIILLVLAIGLIFFQFGYLRDNSSANLETFRINNYNPFSPRPPIEAPGEVAQFIENLRFRYSQISYHVDEKCSETKKAKILSAFNILERETQILQFKENGKDNSEILIACSKESYEQEKNVFLAGEGGPTKYLNLTPYPVILRGKVILYDEEKCDYPVTEIHELLHVFGFDHINDSLMIMYPYVECEQRINPEVLNILKNIYSKKPLPELYFWNVTALKHSKYLNFSVEINNDGLEDAKGVFLKLYADNIEIDEYNLGDIEFSSGTSFKVGNLLLPSTLVSKIKFEIVLNQEEYSKNNNYIELDVQ